VKRTINKYRRGAFRAPHEEEGIHMSVFLMILLILTGIFLIVLILIQRGKGGGLAGAFGGAGGQSAFGTKAGDLFTKITIGAAAFWILLCIISVKVMAPAKSSLINVGTTNPPAQGAPASTEKQSAPVEQQPAAGGESPPAETPSTPTKPQ
jgi:preprotein translocase subunit SecG